MSFDDIPEDREQSFPCGKCHKGSVTQNIINGKWECSQCDFSEGDDDESVAQQHEPIKTDEQDFLG